MALLSRLAFLSERLRDMSATGLLYSKNPYDLENYHHIQDIAMELLALAGGQTMEEVEPLRGPVFDRPTPLVTGDAAIFDAAGRLLLIRRADNGLWALPGGALSVGETPAEGVVREAFEETGWKAEVVALMGVWDSRLCGSVARHQMYHFQFLCRPIEQGAASHAHEALEMGWFLEEEMPEVGNLDPGHRVRVPFAYKFNREPCEAYFDRIGRE